MEKLRFDDGYKELEINGDPERILKYNPGDIGIIDRLEAAYTDVDKQMKDLQGLQISPTGNALDEASEAARIIRGLNESLRKTFDNLFYPGAADIVFGRMNPLALVGGKTIFENFLLAYTKLIKPQIEKEAKAAQKHIEKYKKEYDRMPAGNPKH